MFKPMILTSSTILNAFVTEQNEQDHLVLSAFVGVIYLMKYAHSGKGFVNLPASLKLE